MPVRTIVFDFGNVVAFFDHARAVARLATHTDLSPSELTRHLYGSAIEDAFERGAITTGDYVAHAKIAGRLNCSDADFLTAFVDIFWCNHEVSDLIPRLRPKYRLILASNTNAAHFGQFTQQFASVLSNFDHLCTSFTAGARKPEPAYFAHCLPYAEAQPHECLFLDDLPENVEAAGKVGWKGLVYRPNGTLVDKLRAAGVEIGTK